MANDTILMSGSLLCLLLLNTFVFLYNQEPIEQQEFTTVGVSVSEFQTNINETGIEHTSSGLKAILGIGKFFLNLVILLFGYYTSFPLIVNIIIKLATYVFAIPLFITIVRMIRGN